MIKSNRDIQSYFNRLADDKKYENLIKIKFFKAGQRLIWQGDAPDFVFVIIDGIAKCFITEENGRDYLLEFLSEGEIFGELELLTAKEYICNIEALSDLKTLRIDKQVFFNFLQEDKYFNELIMKELATRLTQTAQRASFQQTYPLEHAILKIVQHFSEKQTPISKQNLADYLGITLRSLNRALRKLNNTE